VLALHGAAAIRLAGPQHTLELDPIADRRDPLARDRCRLHEPVVLDPHRDVAAHQRDLAAILEPEVGARERALRGPVAAPPGFVASIARARRRVRRDAQGIGPQLRETRSGRIQPIEVVPVDAAGPSLRVALLDRHARYSEGAALERAQRGDDRERSAVGLLGVVDAHPDIRRELDQVLDHLEVRRRAVQR
jgi:hypothetical protein